MKHIIIGTAGHIDHGKTTLIKSLTGINTDRLKEEQNRGISIDLGFSHFDIDEQKFGIIDVPGHEKFLKNMLAGVAGMDFVMLIVSADEGVMPQTREHLDILNIIGIKKGIVVVTKIDNVDEDYIELVEDDIRDSVKGTFLEDAPIVLVDSISKRGIPNLIETIKNMSEEVEGKNEKAPARMYIDRIFTVKGFGNVVTGTLVEGTIRVDDELMLYPDEQRVKVRGIQVHSEKSDIAYAGQRVAINLSGIDKEKIQRGDTLAEPNTMTTSMMIDCKISILENATRDLEHWDRVRVYHGAKELLGRVVPLDGKAIKRGEEAYAQIRLEEVFACKTGDKIVIRTYSPMETIGGGVVLEPNAKKHSLANEDILNDLRVKESGNPKDILENFILSGKIFIEDKEIIEKLSISESELKELATILLEEDRLFKVANKFIHKGNLLELLENSKSIVHNYHQKNPLKKGISKEEFKNRLKLDLKPKEYDLFLDFVIANSDIVLLQNIIREKDFEIVYDENSQKIKDAILKRLKEEKLAPSSTKDYIKTQVEENVLESLIDLDFVVKVEDDLIYSKEAIDDLIAFVKEVLAKNKEIQIGDIRDKYNISRKYVVALLEYFDRIRLTKRVGDKRIGG